MCPHRRTSERGQGLVEYALILVLVAIVVIVALTTAGQKVRDIFCDIVVYLDASAAANQPACAAPRVTLVVALGAGSGKINVEAIVKDAQGANTISNVKFYLDGSSTAAVQENQYRYCLGGGNASCSDYSLSSGSHTVRAVATDQDGNTGETTVSVTVP